MNRFVFNNGILPTINKCNIRTYWMKKSLRKRMINKIYERSNN